ncbi:manganese efflux pump MntP [Tannockella kyphosi]|uniref:manganese efflux pump MntP n=1 Tax=Tannockella kyphosi TaxID=2899121 RepID=UPI0020118754|nr:manganese efflux pump MntP family protein [Tannockella kyphosi]
MSTLEMIFIAIALAMDAVSVTIATCAITREKPILYAFKLSLCFGVFQTIMPLFGSYIGDFRSDTIFQIGHWICFGLLMFIGLDMIVEAFKETKPMKNDAWITIFSLALATSIDAFALGVTFSLLDVALFQAVIIIGVITFGLCFFSAVIAYKIMQLYQKQAQIAGGIILIVLAIKIMLEHFS